MVLKRTFVAFASVFGTYWCKSFRAVDASLSLFPYLLLVKKSYFAGVKNKLAYVQEKKYVY